MMKRWLLRLLAALMVLAMIGEAAIVWLRYQLNQPGPALAQTVVVVPRGTGSRAIAALLKEAGAISDPTLFLAELLLTGKGRLQAGEYSFPPHASMDEMIEMMRLGHVVLHRVTVPEGLTAAEVLEILRDTPGLQGKSAFQPDEGSLLPETYQFSYGESRDSLLNRMHKAMVQALDEEWAHRAPDTPLQNKMEALILASIVEKETGLDAERPHVAAVFLNRLRQHMRLQSDPTVIYALTQGLDRLDRALTHDDLAVKSPYNTYVADALPPGAICNPGKASLKAVLHPLKSDDLYFVADGSGGHAFAKTLAEHNKNVTRWRARQNGK